MNSSTQKAAARKFVERWKTASGNEQSESNSFWIELCHEVLDIANPTHVLDFERRVRGKRIDVFYEDMGILIENKSRGVDLDARFERGKDEGGDARLVTPYEQARWYASNIAPRSISPKWVITCNFDEIRIYDMDEEYPEKDFETILLDELPELAHRLSFFTRKENSRLEREKELSVKAGEIVGVLYDRLARQYLDIDTNPDEQRSLNVLIVRLVFLLFAEDAGLLQEHQAFYKYLSTYSVEDTRMALRNLFAVLNTPGSERDPYLSEKLLAFPYVNGGLFADEIVIPRFDEQARNELLEHASAGFDWAKISPTIFGAVFESTLNPESRRSGGMHYTSVENIHKLTGPLFYDGLLDELREIESEKSVKVRKQKLRAFQYKISHLTFFDPACGSGNFLTETFISLRKLELRVIEDLIDTDRTSDGQTTFGMDVDNAIMVSIDQFYGIEINDFAVSVAKTALWIAEQQMMDRTQELLPFQAFEFLPLKSNSNIHEGNALRMEWNDVLPAEKCNYIIGNPPFYGARMQSKEQKEDILNVFHGAKNAGNVDYVAGWYMKAAEYIADFPVRCAFVSTNSICQGEQVANVWSPIFDLGVRIDFAHDTFRWNNEASNQAHVFCVIVGFSKLPSEKRLFHHAGPDDEAAEIRPSNINAYLADAPDVFVWNRNKPLCEVPKIGIGNKPIDGGNYLFTDDDKEAFIAAEPASKSFFHRWLGSKEFINGTHRWVLWLGDATPGQLEDMPKCMERILAVRDFRLASKSAPTRKLAETPSRFHVENMPDGPSVLIPKVSSERRRYIPMGFIGPETFCSDLVFLIPNATLFHYGVLQSQFHNAWMRVVCGRLKSDYRYSGGIVYNNFVWSEPTLEQRARIEQTAQGILDAREAHPGKSLADLYDPDKMPADLKAAHDANDAAVEAAYGVDFNGDEEKIVAHLFKLYARATEGESR